MITNKAYMIRIMKDCDGAILSPEKKSFKSSAMCVTTCSRKVE